MNAIHNERIKLLATFLNSIGVAVFAVGGLAPMFASLYGTNGPSVLNLVGAGICFLTASVLHYAASTILKRMKQ